MTIDRLVVTCEHGGNRVPPRYAPHFASRQARLALAGHRGFDPGALKLARLLARRLQTSLVACTTTRLLIEVNRSVGHPRLYSEFTRRLDRQARHELRARFYDRHRTRVTEALQEAMSSGGPVLHLGVHTFTPQLAGIVRTADVGLLYDPRRERERRLCTRWQASLQAAGELLVRRNYPYRGDADGLTTVLRRRFPAGRYLGIELEINQRLVVGARSASVARLVDALVASLPVTERGRPGGAI